MKYVMIILFSMMLMGCTDNQHARVFGGTLTQDLPPNQKLINVTWKDDDIWFLTRKMKSNETPEEYEFTESSNFGVLQGKLIIKEHQ